MGVGHIFWVLAIPVRVDLYSAHLGQCYYEAVSYTVGNGVRNLVYLFVIWHCNRYQSDTLES